MANEILTNLASKVLESWGKSAFQEAASWWGARRDLMKLENSMRMIRARVHDAEKRGEEEGDDAIKEWLGRLKQVLYQADDLFDKVCTVDRKRRQQKTELILNAHYLPSRSAPLYFNIKIAQEIKSIRRKLDSIKLDMEGLNLNIRPEEPLHLMYKRETASFVQVEDVVGRENDKNMVIKMLLDPKYDREKITVIPIVGFGGLGKTTLAQLVFNDERVQKHFDLARWAYVPEIDNQNEVMRKVFKSLTGESYHELLLDSIKSGIQGSIQHKKYLLVLDDIWDDCRDRWLDLMSLLKSGKLGSKVIVTTRSQVVAKNLSTIPEAYTLGVLGEDESLDLFKRLAFKSGQEESNPNLMQIAKEVVKSSGNVPLAVRVLGSLFYSKDSEEEWRLFRDTQVSTAKLTENSNIMPVLKLSYDNLPARLKQCFAYCSIFPKDYRFSKAELVSLWMAQGYLETSNDGLSLEEVGDQYFSELLWRNFFQDAEEDGMLDDNIFCRMHELMHELAQHVASTDVIIVVDRSPVLCTNQVLHVTAILTESWDSIEKLPQSLLVATRTRSLLLFTEEDLLSEKKKQDQLSNKMIGNLHDKKVKKDVLSSKSFDIKLPSRFRSLRVLYLKGMQISHITRLIGRLSHLRYLNLSDNHFTCLPNTITRLENLQTLYLNKCKKLTVFPNGFTNLVNLRNLGILESSFTDMPLGFENMTCLQQLDKFVIGKNSGIDTLPALKLKGNLTIEFGRWRREAIMEASTVNLKSNEKLTRLLLDMSFRQEAYSPTSTDVEKLLQSVQLPPSLKLLSICYYGGKRFMPRMVDNLTKIVEIRISTCVSCQGLPRFNHLPCLKYLYLDKLYALEYVEDNELWGDKSKPSATDYFPALESLTMWDLPELKNWSRMKDDDEPQELLFSRLSKLDISGCPKLMSMPLVSKFESIVAKRIHGKLLKSLLMPQDLEATSSSSSSSSLGSDAICTNTSLKRLDIWGIYELLSLSVTNLCNLEALSIRQCQELRTLKFESQNSIRELSIGDCSSLRNVSEGLQLLSGLEKLQIFDCEDLDVWDRMDDENDEKAQINSNLKNDKNIISLTSSAWQGLRSLHSLELHNIWKLKLLPIESVTKLQSLNIQWLKNLTALPDNIGHIFQLREIKIIGCPKLESLPQSISSLTFLQELVIQSCPLLERRCKLDGEDWTLIQHIPYISLPETEAPMK